MVLVLAAGFLSAAIAPGVFGTGASVLLANHEVIGSSITLNTASESPDPAAFSFEVNRINRCGTTCGEVTATLTNEQNRQSTNVVVEIRVFAGADRENGKEIWHGTKVVGTMGAHETLTVTRRAKVPISAARAVENRDGVITILVTVKSAEATTIFEGHEQILS